MTAVFGAASRNGWAIAVHLRTQRSDYGAQNVQRFVEDVLPAVSGTPVQIALAGGWGGVDGATLAALGAFADAFQTRPDQFNHVWFDLSGVAGTGVRDTDRRALVTLIRRIGVKHFLVGSDWPYGGTDLDRRYGEMEAQLPLTHDEWAIIKANVAPYAR